MMTQDDWNLLFLVLIFALQAFDFYSTSTAIKAGTAVEANPVMKKMMTWFGVDAALLIKTLAVCTIAGLLYYVGATIQLALIALIYAVFMYNNWRVMNRG